MAVTALCKLARSLLYTQFGGFRLRYLCQQHKGSLELWSEVLPLGLGRQCSLYPCHSVKWFWLTNVCYVFYKAVVN